MVNISFSQERIQRAYGSEEPPETLDTRMGAGNHPCMYTVDMVLRAGQAHSVTLCPRPRWGMSSLEAAVGLSFLLTATIWPACPPTFIIFCYCMSVDAMQELFLVDETPGQSHGV